MDDSFFGDLTHVVFGFTKPGNRGGGAHREIQHEKSVQLETLTSMSAVEQSRMKTRLSYHSKPGRISIAQINYLKEHI